MVSQTNEAFLGIQITEDLVALVRVIVPEKWHSNYKNSCRAVGN